MNGARIRSAVVIAEVQLRTVFGIASTEWMEKKQTR